ncbi:putative toxin-antitoxin system toxin component, PIN family [Mucilaginibacter rigui]|uniref:Toxin-antitoxin system toxin component, PIN family n=1 Tax=Mucilaginibacter rigui TaxID=534635 RepID=A0ABR7X6Z1_9SPHI|nr:putative toxin-antitoxin system toxin component, PIN family [Mucilaginibacter rigui]MBD1386266.1 putative toxin-antitoxin system toxin component, PIN family [Mucilaginibacter rigui]
MPNKATRIVLDTNLWISFLIKNDYTALTSLLLSGRVILVFSAELMSEFIEVTQRTKFKKYFSESNVIALTEIIDDYAEFIDVTSIVTLCRDKKDNFLLSLALDGNVNYLLTGDADLLELNPQEGTKIITISDFLKEVNTL